MGVDICPVGKNLWGMTQFWYEGSSGESPSGPYHTRRDCDDLDGEIRPIAESVLPEDAERCGLCTPLESGSDGGGETCTVEMNSGEICGRDRPCPYHD